MHVSKLVCKLAPYPAPALAAPLTRPMPFVRRISCSMALEHSWIKSNQSLASEPLDMGVIDSLQSFACADDVKKVALEVVAFTTPPEELEKLRNYFISIDSDRSGTISKEEFEKAMTHTQHPSEMLNNLFRQMDVNKTGMVEYMEFIAATITSQNGEQHARTHARPRTHAHARPRTPTPTHANARPRTPTHAHAHLLSHTRHIWYVWAYLCIPATYPPPHHINLPR